MKKLLGIVISLLICATTVFALDLKVDANFVLPVESWSVKEEGEYFVSKIKYSEWQPGFDLTGTYMFTKEWGARLSVGYTFPSEYKYTQTTTSDVTNVKESRSGSIVYKNYYSSVVLFNLNPQAVYTFINKKKYDVSATAGILLQSYTIKYKENGSTISFNRSNFGLTAGVFGTYEFMSNIYATAAVDMGWIMYTQDEYGKSTGIHRFYFAPKIGVGYKF